jgi:hypothetical protein
MVGWCLQNFVLVLEAYRHSMVGSELARVESGGMELTGLWRAV